MDEYYMRIALKEANKSFKYNDVPVGAVIVKGDKVISKAYNKKEKTKIVTKHAEILAIEKACKKLETWRLDDCILYVTLEPCIMCYGAIKEARISKVVYAISSPKYGFTNLIKNSDNYYLIKGNYSKESKKLLQLFFKNKRM